MTATVDQLTEQALALSVEDRAVLAQKVCESIEHFVDPETEQAWLAEADRRWREIEAGLVAGIPADEAMRQARASLHSRPCR